MTRKFALSLAIAALAAAGFFGVGEISHAHWAGEAACPVIGPVPACYVILVGYGLILISVLPQVPFRSAVFAVGWLPVFALALVGVGGEVTGLAACPQTQSGIPKCFISAAMAAVIGLLAVLLRRLDKSSDAEC